MVNRYPVDSAHVLDDYPRPQMVRDAFVCLNGIWELQIATTAELPDFYPYSILVPFPVESALSGCEKHVGSKDILTYRRHFSYPPLGRDRRVLLHFEAVDHQCTVWCNAKEVGRHRGGYLPFCFDITDMLSEENELIVQAVDPNDSQPIIRGKQSLHPKGIFYTAQSGIWQSVWLEEVPSSYIRSLVVRPNVQQRCWHVEIECEGEVDEVVIEYLDGKKQVKAKSNQRICCQVDEPHLWTPEDPYLYPFTVHYKDDVVSSYVGLRSFGVQDGYLTLNGKRYFHHGILDQGYWPFSLMTAPTDQAIIDDLLLVKKLGFNMIRKHVKVESRRWYHNCDRLGLLVWQDMVSGGRKPIQPFMSGPLLVPFFSVKDTLYSCLGSQDESYRTDFAAELSNMIEHLYNVPSIAMWVIFNEGWGQFDTQRMLDRVRSLDQSRTIDATSGWYDRKIGDVSSQHVYFKGYAFKKDVYGRAVVLSEFGGYVYREIGHDEQNRIFGYRTFENRQAFNEAFFTLYQSQVYEAKKAGLSASVYTQLSDVEQELNGLVTYDRLSVKLDEAIGLQVALLLLGSE